MPFKEHKSRIMNKFNKMKAKLNQKSKHYREKLRVKQIDIYVCGLQNNIKRAVL